MADTEPAPRSRKPDLVNAPINRALLLFALPTLGSNVLQSLNGSINSVWIGRFLGEDALAASANAGLLMFLMLAGVFGFGMATTILVGQSMGRGDIVGARRAIGTSMGMFVLMSALIALAGWVFAPELLQLLATPAEAMPLALAYLRVIFLAMPASFLMILLMMGLRGSGDSLTPLWFMVLNVILDAGLNPVFILGLGPAPQMGIAGSAMATLVANYVSLAAMIGYIYGRDLPIRLRGAEWRYLWPDPVLLRVIFAKGLPMGLQMLVVSLSALAMIGLVNREGLVVTAAYGVTQQLWTYIQMPAMAIGAAVSAMAAQNIGAGRWDRVGRIAMSGIWFNLILTGGAVVLITLIDAPAISLFVGADSPALPIARHIHLVAGWGFILFGVMMVLMGVVRANGAVAAPLLIAFVALIPVRLGFAWVAQPLLGVDAIWWSFPAGSFAATVLAIAYYRWGRWRAVKLVEQIDEREAGEKVLADADPCGKLSPTG